MDFLLYALGAFVILGSGVKIKNVIEDKEVLESDEFTRWDSLFKKYGMLYGVDWKWLKAIAMNESRLGLEPSVKAGLLDPSNVEGSKSSDGKSWGLMQVTVTTARDFDSSATAEKLNNPEYSIRIAAQYLKWVQSRFASVDVRWKEWVIKSYNQGAGNTEKERQGKIAGYAQGYWERFLRNEKLVNKGNV